MSVTREVPPTADDAAYATRSPDRASQLYGTWGELLVQALRGHPDACAVIEGDKSYTYDEIAQGISRFGQALTSLGLQRGDGVALLSFNSTNYLLALLATHIFGLRYTPLHPLGGAADHLRVIDDSEVRAVVVSPGDFPEHAARFAEALEGRTQVLTLGPGAPGSVDLVELAARFEPEPLVAAIDPASVACVVYTGGTTGAPKGVVHVQRSWAAAVVINIAEFHWPARPVTFACTPFGHAAWTLIAPTWHRRGTLVVEPRFSADRFLETVAQHGVTSTWLVPTAIYALLDHPKLDETDLSSLHNVLYGGGPMAVSRMREALDRIGSVFIQSYGQTETVVATMLPPEDHDPERRPELLASVGRAVAGVAVAVLDEDDNVVEDGEIGEIAVRSPCVMEAYWKRPDLTEERLRGGWKRTGDIGRMDGAGYVYLLDRKEDMIVSGGFNVYPREVEEELMSHADVAAAAVCGVTDPKWGEAVHAWVVRREAADPTADALKRHVRDRKGPVATPKHVHFLAELPLTPIGKVDRKALRAAANEAGDHVAER